MQRKTTTISKSASAPNLVKEHRAATQAFLAAVGSGNVQAMRTLALECGADPGTRAYNILGHSPKELLAQMDQLTPQQRVEVKQQLTELPRLISAVDAARGGTLAAGSESRRTLQGTLRPEALAGATRSATVLPKLVDKAQTQTHAFREQRAKIAMTTLGEFFREPELAYKAALSNPRLTKVASESGGPVLQALAASLRSEELAARTVERSPALLKRDPQKVQQVVPVLLGLMAAEDVSYLLSVRPAVLEVERPQQLRQTVNTIAEIMCSFADAQWLVTQSLVPTSIVVSTRAWCSEELVGEFSRMLGVRMQNRPVYKKPAKVVKHHGTQATSKARDAYVLYDEGNWLFTTSFDEHAIGRAGKTRTGFRRAAPGTSGASPGGQSALAQLSSESLSPDQALGVWNVLSGDELSPDRYFQVADRGAKRGRDLLTIPPPVLRRLHNHLKEALGPFWLEDNAGAAPKGRRYIGNLRVEDPLHLGSSSGSAAAGPVASGAAADIGTGLFKGLGDFTPKRGFSYIQTTVQARADPLVLTAWEPIVVFMMFYVGPGGDDDPEDLSGVDQPSASGSRRSSNLGSNAGSKQGSKAGSKTGSKAGSRKGSIIGDSAPSQSLIGAVSYWQRLADDGWLPVALGGTGALRPPELREVGPITKMLSRCYLRGRVEIPAHSGRGPPPLIFVHTQLAARDADMVPCEARTPARPGEAIFSGAVSSGASRRRTVDQGANIEAGEANVLDEADDTGLPKTPCLEDLGDVGFSEGFSLVRPRFPHKTYLPSDVQIVIDTADPIRVVVAWFHLPNSLSDEESQIDQSDHSSPPAWVEVERWRPFVTSMPVVLLSDQGVQVKASYLYVKDFGPGEIAIHGSGTVTSVVLWKGRGEQQADRLQHMLLRRPSLLASGDVFSFLKRHLRAELGNALTRKVLLEQSDEWARLCETGGTTEVEAWVASLKIAAFAAELRGGAAQAKALVERTVGLASVTLPQFCECCAVLSESLGSSRAMLAVATKVPELLTVNAACLRDNLAALARIFEAKDAVYQICNSHPRLLLKDGQIAMLFDKLDFHHPDISQRRLQERTSGEWARWPEMVGQSGEVVASWLGRIMAEERAAACRGRVQFAGL